MAANASKPRPVRPMRYDARPFAMSKDEALAMHRSDASNLRDALKDQLARAWNVRTALRKARSYEGFLSWNPFRLRAALKAAEKALNEEE